jgi:peptide deformylase
MAILKIARMGHPVLRIPAETVADPTLPEIRDLVADMIETMFDAGGTGLAAPQVHVPKRVVVFQVGESRVTGRPLDQPQELMAIVNPVIEPLGEEQELDWEGCLSVPGMRGAVPRFSRIRYRGRGLDGKTIERSVEGFHARVLQHECDHLDGILYPQRMTDLRLLMFSEEAARFPIDIGSNDSGGTVKTRAAE